MNEKKYPNFIKDIKNYLIAIGNYSKLYVENIITTVSQFLEFINEYKFDHKYNSINEMTDNDIRSISKSDIYSFIYYLSDNDYKEGSRILKLEHLRTFFDYMFRIKNDLFREPFKEIKREKRCSSTLPKYLSLEEAQKLLDVYKNGTKEKEIRDYAMLSIFLTCGLRLSEIITLNISDINLKENKFTIIGKGNKERMCYLNELTKNAVLKYLEIRETKKVTDKKDKDILFLSNLNKRLSRSAVKLIVKTVFSRAEIDPKSYSVHTLRHTCATLLLKSGTDIRIIQEILGHSRIETTQIYTHIYNKNVEKAMLEHPLAQFKYKQAIAYSA